jgi:hypothetical protein
MSVDDVVQIPVSSIVVAVDVQELAFKQYTKYLESMDELDSFEEELIELGDDPDAFEDFITSVLGSGNEEEEDDRIGRVDTRTLH